MVQSSDESSIPSIIQDKESPIPVPISSIFELGFDVINVFNRDPVKRSDGMVKPISVHFFMSCLCIAGIPELIKNNENGILFPAGDSKALEKGISEFLNMPADALKSMRLNAYESVERRHNVDTEATKLVGYFKGEV